MMGFEASRVNVESSRRHVVRRHRIVKHCNPALDTEDQVLCDGPVLISAFLAQNRRLNELCNNVADARARLLPQCTRNGDD